ncbi:histamine H2 receptor-like [Actinia tenebrosa]|uniref:Histamine H2 receptor-like n=1 Tax=Actinia tenebrosa TaxID=6105 RepID=A0A6P8HVC5_ACTTE|nr:histamine H2 receptor-like [Actinia tenebrosa]XP_031556547.1 histamine H2 receptor-like [Actinia tenebrosa]
MNRSQYIEYLNRELYIRETNRKTVSTSLAIVFIVLEVGGNFVVCYAVLKTKKLYSLTNFFLVILSLSDLVRGIVLMPIWIDVLLNGQKNFTDNGCKFTGFTSSFCIIGKLFTVLLICMNRLTRVYRPSTYDWLFQKWFAVAMVTVTWLTALTVVIILTTSGLAKIEFHPGRAICLLIFEDQSVFQDLVVAQFIFSVIIPLCLNVLSHFKAFNDLKEHKREAGGKIRVQIFNKRHDEVENELENHGHDIEATRTLLGVVYGYIFCSTITTSIILADAFRPYYFDRGTHLALTFFLFVNGIINPALFSRTNKPFRDVCLEIFGCKWSRRVIHVQ